MRRATAAVRPVLAAVLLVAATPSGARQARLEVEPSYYRPVVVDGFTFPVARSSWLSYVQFENDWHEPRFRRIGGRWQLVGVHEGNDILAEKGAPILAATGGVVEATGWTFYSGERVGVRGDDGKYYFYAHLSAYAPGIAPGARVEPGDVLGLVGNTGYGPPGREDRFAPHLHFGIEGPGGWENPYPLVARLYRRSVAVTSGLEARLARAARRGDAARFEDLSAALYEPALGNTTE